MSLPRKPSTLSPKIPAFAYLIKHVKLYQSLGKSSDVTEISQANSIAIEGDKNLFSNFIDASYEYIRRGKELIQDGINYLTRQNEIDAALDQICSDIITKLNTLELPKDCVDYLLELPKKAEIAQGLKRAAGVSKCFEMVYAVKNGLLILILSDNIPDDELKPSQLLKTKIDEIKSKLTRTEESMSAIFNKKCEGNWGSLDTDRKACLMELSYLGDMMGLEEAKKAGLFLNKFETLAAKEKRLKSKSFSKNSFKPTIENDTYEELPYIFQPNYAERWYEDHFSSSTRKNYFSYLEIAVSEKPNLKMLPNIEAELLSANSSETHVDNAKSTIINSSSEIITENTGKSTAANTVSVTTQGFYAKAAKSKTLNDSQKPKNEKPGLNL